MGRARSEVSLPPGKNKINCIARLPNDEARRPFEMRSEDDLAGLERLADFRLQDFHRGHGFREAGGEHPLILDDDTRGIRLDAEGEVRVIEAGEASPLHFALEVVPEAPRVMEERGFPPLHGVPRVLDGVRFRFEGLDRERR